MITTRGTTKAEYAEIKKALKALPFKMSVRRLTSTKGAYGNILINIPAYGVVWSVEQVNMYADVLKGFGLVPSFQLTWDTFDPNMYRSNSMQFEFIVNR